MNKEEQIKAVKFLKDCRDPFFFTNTMWGLKPQPCKPEYRELLETLPPNEWEAIHFGDCERKEIEDGKYYMHWTWHDFTKGKHLTWQQTAMLTQIKNHTDSLGDEIALEQFIGWLTVASGHGIGKSMILSVILLWFLFCFPEAQVAATAPSKQQIYDILWKELSIWLNRMPKIYSQLYDWQNSYIRMKDLPDSWFARAATARKENPEALAGVHGDHVLLVADEASGVEEVIFETAEGATTGGHVMFMMISNPTRNTGYFKNSHAKDKSDWVPFSFSCEESPVVDLDYVIRMAKKYDRDEDNFRFRVLGLFPHEDQMDDKGYMPLISERELEGAMVPANTPFKARKLGIDPSGAGADKSAWVGGNTTMIKILGEEKISTPISGARKTHTYATEHEVPGPMCTMDSFGEGGRWIAPIQKAGLDVDYFNSGDPSTNSDYLNKRAEGAWKLRTFIKNGGQIVRDQRWKEILNIKYRRTTRGKIQIMPKEEMKKNRIPSPNFFDAACYVFIGQDASVQATEEATDAETAKYEEIVKKRQMKRYG